MSDFRHDYDWQLKFLEPIKSIVGPLLLTPAPFDVDTKEATDMLVLKARDMRIACRVRRPGYDEQYPWEFTVRSKRDSGSPTELEKITDGWGDWMLYGHAKEGTIPSFSRWFVIDLSAWRAQQIRSKGAAGWPKNKANGDGTYFVAFDIRRFNPQPSLLIHSSHEVPDA